MANPDRYIIDRPRRQKQARLREVDFTAEHETFLAHQTNLPSSFDETSADEATVLEPTKNLPPDPGQAVRMLKLEEMTSNEAAHASALSGFARKAITHRGIRSLQKFLLKPGETP